MPIDPVPSRIRAFTVLESQLRTKYGEGALVVKPMVYDNGWVVGGWAFLDGEPAILPDGLTVLVVTHEVAGAMQPLGRDPAKVLALLGARVTKQSDPCSHYTVTVAEKDKAELLAAITAMPEHKPGAGAETARKIGGIVLVGLLALVVLGLAATFLFGH